LAPLQIDVKFLRVLILEDEWLIALDMQEMLEGIGFQDIVGPAASVGMALDLLAREPVDIALLDLQVGKEKSYGVAEALRTRHIPFLFVTGNSREDLRADFRNEALLSKPVDVNLLVDQLNRLLQDQEGVGSSQAV
jgi:CheY-like chemotaxis protein